MTPQKTEEQTDSSPEHHRIASRSEDTEEAETAPLQKRNKWYLLSGVICLTFVGLMVGGILPHDPAGGTEQAMIIQSGSFLLLVLLMGGCFWRFLHSNRDSQ